MRRLEQLVTESAGSHPDNVALVDPARGHRLSYRELDSAVDTVSALLEQHGVLPGDRVGVCAPKSVGIVASIFGILKSGAAYVPVAYDSPVERNAFIFNDCSVSAIILEKRLFDALAESYTGPTLTIQATLPEFDDFGLELVLATPATRSVDEVLPGVTPGTLSYILYTSGSTGTPKGVIHTHASALSFVDWCSECFVPTEADRFSAHAPFHFDLSILDIYVPLKHGATLVLINEDLGKQPAKLAQVICDEGITAWYSTPSILRLLTEYGKMDGMDFSALRIVNFAGEVFPIKQFHALKTYWPHPQYFNLYGPTETNVCTYYAVPADVPEESGEDFPIGIACSGDRLKVMDSTEAEVPVGTEGELYANGGSIMLGYWNLPERKEEAFYVDESGERWYKTGDIVKEDSEGCLTFLGRRDRMVKRRGYRVELGEIESILYRHPFVAEAAVIALPDEESGVNIRAYLNWSGEEKPSLIAMKQYSAQNLPLYMVPDEFRFLAELPKTSTDKIDYQKLKTL